MIYEIESCYYNKIKQLVEDVENFPEIKAVIDNNNPGKVYVDNNDNPKTALVWNQGMQGFYFVGNYNNDNFLSNIKEHINERIINELTSKEINWFEISGVNDRWNQRIEELFKDREIKYGYQLAYLLNKNKFFVDYDVVDKFNIGKVDRDTFKLEITNLDFLKNELELFWGTLGNFYEHGICYYAIEDNKIASVCYSGFKSDNILTIGIETLKEYRRKGHAFSLASKFIEDCNNHGIIPYWDCSEDNIGSKTLAEKLGFEKNSQYRCYWFNF